MTRLRLRCRNFHQCIELRIAEGHTLLMCHTAKCAQQLHSLCASPNAVAGVVTIHSSKPLVKVVPEKRKIAERCIALVHFLVGACVPFSHFTIFGLSPSHADQVVVMDA